VKVADVMVRDVVTIQPSASLVEAAKRMEEANVGVLPVVEDGELRGVITDRDLVVRAIARNADPASTPVAACATSDTVWAQPDWDIEQAMDTMARQQVGRLPVVEDGGRVVGIVTLSSLALRSREGKRAVETAKEVSRRSVKGPAEPVRSSTARKAGGQSASRAMKRDS
jgi:CBS domain-containing protein